MKHTSLYLTMGILAAVAVASIIGMSFALPYLQSLNNSQNTIEITGNSLTQTYPIKSNSEVDITCNYCQITLQNSNSSIIISLSVTGNYNSVTIISGHTKIDVTGNYNTIYASQTTVLSTDNNGNSNTIQTS